MLQRANGNGALPATGMSSVLLQDPREPSLGPITTYGGTINDVKAVVPVDDDKLISLEARLCGIQ